jgi:hydrogenase maturation factor
MKQAREAAGELGMAIVAGHTARYEGIETPVGVCTAYGSISEKDLVTPAGARPGDALLVAGPIGLEIAVNLVLENPGLGMELFGARRARELSRLVPWQSCARDALLLAKSGHVRALHDLTEGGLVASLNEVADASGTGFAVEEALLPIPEEVGRMAQAYGLRRRQLLSMSSTGTFIAAVPPGREEAALEALSDSGRPVAIVGRFTEDPERVIVTARARRRFPRRFDDPYERIITREEG